MAYVYPNFKSKKALKEAVAQGHKVTVALQTPWGEKRVFDGMETLEGPHYPEPHRWYATCQVEEGFIVKGTVK